MGTKRPEHCTSQNTNPRTWLVRYIDGRNYYVCNDCHKQVCREDKDVIDRIYNPLMRYDDMEEV